jgi:hypothetical protein
MKNSNLRTLLFAMMILSLLLFLPAQIVNAEKPVREPLPSESFVTSDACEFDVYFEVFTSRSFITTFFDTDGNPTRMLITGALKGQLTNLSNNKSMDVNVSGPGRVILNEDGTQTWYSGGTWFLGLYPEDAPDFQPRAFLYSGKMVLEIGGGNITSITLAGGHLVDVCAALSD